MEKNKKLTIVIVILAVLLGLSGGGLAARYIYFGYFGPARITAAASDNLIGGSGQTDADSTLTENASFAESGPLTENVSLAASGSSTEDISDGQTVPLANASSADSGAAGATIGSRDTSSKEDKPAATVVELYAGRPDANQRFEVGNMLPGDVESRYFCVKVYHDADIRLFFKADIIEQTKSLGDALHIRVTHLDSGEVLCDAPFADIDGREFSRLLTAKAQEETTACYQIDVSLDTSAGNEYQAAKLAADFEWYVNAEEEEEGKEEGKEEGEGGLNSPPRTGDTQNLVLWAVFAASSLLLILLLAFTQRKKGGRRHE